MKRWMLVIFAVVCAAQLSIPAWMIYRREKTLREGEVFLFQTRPVDPYDAFRGRYVALDFAARSFSNDQQGVVFKRKQKVYGELGVDADGFAVITALHEKPPGKPSIRVVVLSQGDNTAWLRFPMDRYYLEESMAPEAERLYMQHSRANSTNTFAVVRILNAFPVIEDLVINGKPVMEYAAP